MMPIQDFSSFLEEKKSPYKKATLLKYKRKWENGDKIPIGIENSLKAQGMIPRSSGEIEVSDDYKDDFLKSSKKKVVKESFQDLKDSAEVTFKIRDKKGGEVEVREIEGIGMAGENMTFAYIFHNGEISSREKVKPFIKSSDFQELSNYLNDITDNNEASAISFVK